MLDGQVLSDEEVCALGQFLEHASPEDSQHFVDDFLTDGLLRESFSNAEAEPPDKEATRQFVDRVRQRIAAQEMVAPEPPPVVVPVSESEQLVMPPPEFVGPPHPQASDFDSELTTAQSGPVGRVGNPVSSKRFYWAATAASIMIVIAASFLYSRHNRSPQQADAKDQGVLDNVTVAPTPNTPPSTPQVAPPTPDPFDTPRSVEVVQDGNPPVLPTPNVSPSEVPVVPISPDAVATDQSKPDMNPDDPVSVSIQDDVPSPSRPLGGELASLVAQSDAVWGDGVDSARLTGNVQLVSGQARLRLAKGAEVTLKGPAELVLNDENSIELSSGSVAAFVPKSAVGFTVQAPGARVVDLGTRFTVQTDVDRPYTVVQVTEGKVDAFQPPIHPRGRERKSMMEAGRIKWFPKEGGQAYDWMLTVEFGDVDIQREHLKINGETFDLNQATDRVIALDRIKTSFLLAATQNERIPRGQRFAGLVVVNDVSQKLLSTKQLEAAETFLTTQIQNRFGATVRVLSPMEMMNDLQQRLRTMMGTRP